MKFLDHENLEPYGITHSYATNSKAIASYTQTVTQLDTKLAFLKTA